MRAGLVKACWTPGMGGVAEGVLKMALGNRIGFCFDAALPADVDLFGSQYGSFLLEVDAEALVDAKASAEADDEPIADAACGKQTSQEEDLQSAAFTAGIGSSDLARRNDRSLRTAIWQ